MISKPMVALASLALAISIPMAATISGQVTDERGEPIAGADLDFYVVSTGNEEKPSGDTTDATGHYTTLLPNEVYDVYYSPPLGSPYAGHVERNVNLNTNQTVNVVLRDAFFVRGKVLRADTGGPAVGVDLDFEDLSSGAGIFTPADNTDLFGEYSVAVPVGVYDVAFEGPQPEFVTDPPQLAPHGLVEISVTGSGDLVLPTITLELGHEVSGEVLNDKLDAENNADLDFIDAVTGERVFTKADNTDADGKFATILPVGTYDIKINPAAGSFSPSKWRRGVAVAAPIDIGVEILPEGFGVGGSVRDPQGGALWLVELDFATVPLGDELPTTEDNTGADGRHLVRVPAGQYDITYRPRRNSLVLPTTRSSVLVTSDRELGDTLLSWNDEDGDGVADVSDLCPTVADATQVDGDLDGVGDACDLCPASADSEQRDNDGDGVGDACDPDDDGDGLGDGSDGDRDGDGVVNLADNCPEARNPGQADVDLDGLGDACDNDDGLVQGVRALGGRSFTWIKEAGATAYHVYRQDLAYISAINYGTCRGHELPARLYHDDTLPKPGRGFFYLVSALGASGEGGLGQNSQGEDRPNLRRCP